jgi:murein DD-endopeptidase MepM/ murein hydrolase activator NlpD
MVLFIDSKNKNNPLKQKIMAFHKNHPKRQSERLWKGHKKGWAVLLTLLMTSTLAVKDNAVNLQLSVLTVPDHAAFDGTVAPIQEVPDWVAATATEEDLTFNEFPSAKLVATPSYVPSRLREEAADLDWGDSYDDHTRRMKITYSVPYAGTYKFDGIEGIGSHPGIDIKTIKGTPVYAIANGVVDKLTYSNAGFGNLIVIRHDNVPTYEDANKFTTLHSGYAHLNDIFITDGAVVKKGDMIGTVGDTGTATTDHLHFQLDNDDAPWHLYWPFTSAEASKVGGFWEAVNEGVGQENVYSYTENPMAYVQKYSDPDADYGEVPEVVIESETIEEPIIEVVEEEEEEEVVEVVTPVVVDEGPFTSLELDYDPYLLLNEKQQATLTVLDKVGELVQNPNINSPIKLTASDPSVLRISPDQLDKNSIRNGVATIEFIPLKVGSSDFTITFFGKTYLTGEIVIPLDREPLDSFAIETDHHYTTGEPEPVVVVALNKSGERITDFDLSEPVKLEIVQGNGVFSRDSLVASDFERGLATVNFTSTSNDTDVIIKVTNGELKGASSILSSSLFADVEESHPYYQAIAYLKTQGVIQGYEDDTFRPDKAVSRVEALKLLFAGLGKEVVTGTSIDFPDTDSGAWYAPYVATAQRDGVVKGYPDGYFRPGNEVNRVEMIKMLIGVAGVDTDPVVIGNPYDDVHYLEWYAPYAQFVKLANLTPWTSKNLEPSLPMTRGDVAEMIYRTLALQENGADKYSRTLVLN